MINCNLCQSESKCISKDQLSDHGFVYDLYRCQRCGFESKINQKNIEEIYKFIYDENSFIDRRFGSFKKGSEPERKYLKPIIDQYAKKPFKLLEIGPGSGATLFYAKENNFITASLDVSERNNQYYQSECNVDFVFNNIKDIQDDFYDLVIMTHVIEHVENPSQMLEEVSKKIKVNGEIVISTPNSKCIFKSIFGVDWWPYLIDDHVSFFSLDHLDNLLKEKGFKTQRKFSFGVNAAHSLSSYLKRKNRPHKKVLSEVKTDAPSPSKKRKLRAMITQFLERVFLPFSWFGMGYEIVAVGKKVNAQQ